MRRFARRLRLAALVVVLAALAPALSAGCESTSDAGDDAAARRTRDCCNP
jgi:hypothetical protein